MSCAFTGRDGRRCENAADPQCLNWNAGSGFCTDHIERVRRRLYTDNPGRGYNAADETVIPVNHPEKSYVEDYIKIFALLMDKEFCREQMTVLQSEIVGGFWKRDAQQEDERFRDQRSGNHEADSKYVRLSRVLEYYEAYCWFPVTRRLYTGSLSSESYVSSIALGYMPKDAGAGADHGEFSHRLQWHIIMRVVTNGFQRAPKRAGWTHSPLDLFTHLGAAWSMQQGIWGFICDDGSGMAYNNPAMINRDLCGGFEVNGRHAEEAAKSWRKGNMMLCAAAQRRTSKRMSLLERAKAMLRKTYPDEPGAAFIGNVVGLIEKWKKIGKPGKHIAVNVGAQWTPDMLVSASYWGEPGVKAHNALHNVALLLWNQLVHDGQIVAGAAPRYTQDPNEQNALLPLDVDPMSAQQINARIARSNQVGFNTAQYQYCLNQGVYRV